MKGLVVAFAVILAAVAWVTVLIVTDADQDQELRQAQARAGNLAVVFEEQVYRQVLSVDQNLRTLESDWERNPANFDYPSLQRRASAVSDLVSQMVMIDSRGRVIATTNRSLADADLSGRRYFDEHRNDKSLGPLITGPFQSNGSWYLNVSRRLNGDHGAFGGVVAAAYDLNALTRDMAQADLGPRGIIMLVGHDGIVRAMWIRGGEDPGANIRNSPLFHAIMDDSSAGWTGKSGPDQDLRIHAWRAIPGQDMVLVVGLDRSAALSAAETRRRQGVLGAAALTLLVLVMAGGIGSIISAAAMREQRLAADREVLEAANQQLALARERADEKSLQLGMTLAGMSDGISMFDAGLKLVQWNDRYAELNGLQADALRVGLPLRNVLEMQILSGEFGKVELHTEIERRTAELQRRIAVFDDQADPPVSVRTRPDGTVVELPPHPTSRWRTRDPLHRHHGAQAGGGCA